VVQQEYGDPLVLREPRHGPERRLSGPAVVLVEAGRERPERVEHDDRRPVLVDELEEQPDVLGEVAPDRLDVHERVRLDAQAADATVGFALAVLGVDDQRPAGPTCETGDRGAVPDR
jgi:hypothetical protein